MPSERSTLVNHTTGARRTSHYVTDVTQLVRLALKITRASQVANANAVNYWMEVLVSLSRTRISPSLHKQHPENEEVFEIYVQTSLLTI